MVIWNPWKEAPEISKSRDFDLPIRQAPNGGYELQASAGPICTCVSSDFFLQEADGWRRDAWNIIRERTDLRFVILAKNIRRFLIGLPGDWGTGYENVTIVCVCENQAQADDRMPVFLKLPIVRREVRAEPLTEELFLEPYLESGRITRVVCGGESGEHGRLCCYEWVLQLREQCVRHRTEFCFSRTGTNFQKGEKCYRIAPEIQKAQAKKAGIDYIPQTEIEERAQFMDALFLRLSKSEFRRRFRLEKRDTEYAEKKGRETIRRHAEDFVRQRLAPAEPANDGRQTPMRGHPVFPAQHATGTCCRGCLYKWHRIEKGRELSEEEQAYIVSVICEWIARQMKSMGKDF